MLRTSPVGNWNESGRSRTTAPAGRGLRGSVRCVGADPADARRARRTRQRAFTLIETLVVLAVIGLLMAVVIPRVGRIPSGLVYRTTISRFRSALQTAAMRARATGRFIRVRYDPEARSLHMEDAGGGGEALVTDDAVFHPGGDTAASPGAAPEAAAERSSLYRDVSTWTLPADVKCTARDASGTETDEIVFVFDPDGELSGPDVEISIGKRRALLVPDAFSGRISVEEPASP